MCESLLDSYELPLKDVGLHTCTVAIGIFLRTTCPQRDFQNISESIVVHMDQLFTFPIVLHCLDTFQTCLSQILILNSNHYYNNSQQFHLVTQSG